MAGFKIRSGASWVDPSAIKRWTGSAWASVNTVRVWNGSAWVIVWQNSPTVTLPSFTINAVSVDAGSATATFSVVNDGNYTVNGVDDGDWVDNKAILDASDFEARLTYDSGDTLSSGTAGSWLNLATTRTWGMSRLGTGIRAGTYLLEIRQVSNPANIDSCYVYIEAEVI